MIEGPGLLFTLLSFVAAFTVLVFVHEWGHFSVGRWFGTKVEVFSIGFGPELYGWTDKKGTRWKISALPIGGYVKFFGDRNAASSPSDQLDAMTPEERAVSFHHKPLAQRAAIIFAGPAINFLFAIVIFAGLFMTLGQPYSPPTIAEVQENSAAEAAGFQPGDRILSVDGTDVRRFEDLQHLIAVSAGQTLDISIRRGDAVMTLQATPKEIKQTDRFGNEFNVGRLGVARGPSEFIDRGPIDALFQGAVETYNLTRLMLVTTGQIIMGVRSIEDLGGPVKIAKISGEQASLGIVAFISFMALISVNLGLVNLFPIPMLDGGHLLFYAMEAIKGSPVSVRVQELASMLGFIFVVGLMLLLTWNDLSSL